MNIVETIRENARGRLESVAVLEGDLRITYGELLSSVDALATELRALGVAAVRPVALVCGDGPEYIQASLALLSLGAAVVPIPPEGRAEIRRAIDEIDPEFVLAAAGVVGGDGGEPLTSLRERRSTLLVHRRVTQASLPPQYASMGPAFIRFSSGTTSRSKGVVLSHQTIHDRIRVANAGLGITAGDRVLWVLSMSYHFVVTILLFLRQGATIVLCGGEFPASLVDGLARHDATVLYASPFHFRMMTSSSMFSPRSLAGVRLAVCTAMRLPVLEAQSFREKFGLGLSEAYGIIEVGLPFLNDSGDPAKDGSVGPAQPGFEHRLANPDSDGVGEVLLRGPGLFDAYFTPWQTRDEALDDGWFRTGDLARTDDDGFLYLRGRRKNVINFTGMKVFAEEVEAVLDECPGVRESFVYARPHDEFGELPCADVVLETEAAVDDRQIRRFCYRHLASYKVPKEIRLVGEIPRTASGKIRRWQP